jgi:uncharacterized protein YcaQ
MMLTILKAQGKIMIAGRKGNQRLWNLTEQFLPAWTPKGSLSDRELARCLAERSLRALGIARARHVRQHYVRGCYPDLDGTLARLEAEEHTVGVEIQDGKTVWPGPWFVHAEDVTLLDSLETGHWQPRTTLLSPFDNLISDRKRTEQLFNFHYRFEVYTPKDKRKYGCYVMPILQGDRLIGRIDPLMDRKTKTLMIKAIYAEPDAPESREAAEAVANAIGELGAFLKAKEVCYSRKVPACWKRVLR